MNFRRDIATGRTRPAGVHHALEEVEAACGHAVVNRSAAGVYPVTCKACIRKLDHENERKING